jgi:hypothetical protein
MAVPKTLRQIASLTSSFISSFTSFTSEAQDERNYEEYLRGPTYEDVHPAKSREATPTPRDRDQSPRRSVGVQRQATLEPVEEIDSDSEYVHFHDTIQSSMLTVASDDVVPSIELPEDLGDLIRDSAQEAPSMQEAGPSHLPDTARPTDLVKDKRRRGGRIGKLPHHKTRPLIDKLLAKHAKELAAGRVDNTPPKDTYRLIDQKKLAEVEAFDDDKYVQYPEDEGSCLLM